MSEISIDELVDRKTKGPKGDEKTSDKMKRIATGIPGYDELIEGGFPIGSVNILAGIAGSAKSIWVENLAWNIINNSGMKVLYINFEQPEWEIIDQGKQFGWDFSAMIDEGLLKFVSIDAQDLWNDEEFRDIEKQIIEGKYQVVILDSISSVYESPISSDQVLGSGRYTPEAFMEARRAHMVYLINRLKRLKVTVICTAQKVEGKPGDTTDNIIEFKGDSLTLLDFVEVGDDLTRTVRVKKMRKTNINGLTHPFKFTPDGIVITKKEV